MRAFLAAALVVVTGAMAAGCATTDVKGRERVRVGALRGARVVAARVDPAPVRIDAGTNVLTDEELAAMAQALPGALERAFAARAREGTPRALGTARVLGCRVDAGPGRAHTVYEARCRVVLVVGDASDAGEVPVVEVHTQAVRRTRSRAISESEAKEIAKLERNPLLSAEDTRLALEAALDAAAALIVGDALPVRDGAAPAHALSPEEKRALARARYQRARAGDGNLRAAVHDLAEAGLPEDGRLLARDVDAQPAADVTREEIDALGVLCAPDTAPSLARLTQGDAPSPHTDAIARAQATLGACARVPP